MRVTRLLVDFEQPKILSIFFFKKRNLGTAGPRARDADALRDGLQVGGPLPRGGGKQAVSHFCLQPD